MTCCDRFAHANAAFIGVAGDHRGRMHGEFSDTLEHILGRVGRKIGDQLVVDGQVGRQHEKVADAVGQIQVADKRTHQAGLAHTGGQGKAQGGKFALKVRHRGKLVLDGRQAGPAVSASLPGGAISVMRWRISNEMRWGGRRLNRPEMAFTCRFNDSSPL
jgi:hypothetical protein